jgi:hypothetical protein
MVLLAQATQQALGAIPLDQAGRGQVAPGFDGRKQLLQGQAVRSLSDHRWIRGPRNSGQSIERSCFDRCSMTATTKGATMSSQLWMWLMLVIAALAWVRYAKHPTARNLRAAVAATLDI